MKFREKILSSGTRILLGKDAKNNDELMKKFKSKNNTILHTVASGSPFCVIEKLSPSKKDIAESGAIVARYSQDWRNNKRDVKVHVFTGKGISKGFWMKPGTWKVKKKNQKTINIKKKDILKIENDSRTSSTRKKRNN